MKTLAETKSGDIVVYNGPANDSVKSGDLFLVVGYFESSACLAHVSREEATNDAVLNSILDNLISDLDVPHLYYQYFSTID